MQIWKYQEELVIWWSSYGCIIMMMVVDCCFFLPSKSYKFVLIRLLWLNHIFCSVYPQGVVFLRQGTNNLFLLADITFCWTVNLISANFDLQLPWEAASLPTCRCCMFPSTLAGTLDPHHHSHVEHLGRLVHYTLPNILGIAKLYLASCKCLNVVRWRASCSHCKLNLVEPVNRQLHTACGKDTTSQ